MSATRAVRLTDPNGAVLIVTRVLDSAYTFAMQLGENDDGEPVPFRLMTEDDRIALHEFLGAHLDG